MWFRTSKPYSDGNKSIISNKNYKALHTASSCSTHHTMLSLLQKRSPIISAWCCCLNWFIQSKEVTKEKHFTSYTYADQGLLKIKRNKFKKSSYEYHSLEIYQHIYLQFIRIKAGLRFKYWAHWLARPIISIFLYINIGNNNLAPSTWNIWSLFSYYAFSYSFFFCLFSIKCLNGRLEYI